MANRGFSDPSDRNNPAEGVARRRDVKDPTGEWTANVADVLTPETVGCQFARGGWDKYEVPTSNPGDETPVLHKFLVPGGNANSDGHQHVTAAYPGGTVA